MSKATAEAGSRKLIDHMVGAAELGHPRALLATTFDLSPEFVDIDFLPSILRLPSFDNRRVRSRVLLEGQLAEMSSVAMLMEARRFQGRPRSMRVDVRPARKSGAGVLHAKVVLVVHDDAVRLVVGSANLTTSGYRENREVALALRADRKRPEEAALVRQALAEMPTLLKPWWSEAAERVHKQALAVLEALKAPTETDDAAFVWGGGERALWRRVLELWPNGEPVQRIRIVSPFWSDETGEGPVARLLSDLRERKALAANADLLLVTDAVGETNTTYRPVLPATYGEFDFRTLGVTAKAVAAKPQVDEEDGGRDDVVLKRALHAKVLILEGSQTGLAYVRIGELHGAGVGIRKVRRCKHRGGGRTSPARKGGQAACQPHPADGGRCCSPSGCRNPRDPRAGKRRTSRRVPVLPPLGGASTLHDGCVSASSSLSKSMCLAHPRVGRWPRRGRCALRAGSASQNPSGFALARNAKRALARTRSVRPLGRAGIRQAGRISRQRRSRRARAASLCRSRSIPG